MQLSIISFKLAQLAFVCAGMKSPQSTEKPQQHLTSFFSRQLLLTTTYSADNDRMMLLEAQQLSLNSLKVKWFMIDYLISFYVFVVIFLIAL